jgi:DNA-binding NarL/FixJ family response regulator
LGSNQTAVSGRPANLLFQTIQLPRFFQNVIVLDLHMPDAPGPGLLEIRSHLNGALLVATSVWSDSDTIALADSIGADIFLDKASLGTELLPTIVQLTSPTRNRAPRTRQTPPGDS